MNQEAPNGTCYVLHLHLPHQGGHTSLTIYRRKPLFCPHWGIQNQPKFVYPASTMT